MLNYIWLTLVLGAVLIGGFTGKMKEVTDGAVNMAGYAVTLAIGLIGIMALWLGMMRLAEQSGLVQALARALRPILRWLFPEVPANHPAMGAMVLNVAANMLGLANAATPLGLRAMKDLESLNPHPGTATNAMCTFLTINTSSVQLLPATSVALLASAGSLNPTAIIGTAFAATICSTIVGVTAVKSFEKLRIFRAPEASGIERAAEAKPEETDSSATLPETKTEPLGAWPRLLLLAFAMAFVFFFLRIAYPESFGYEPTEEQLTEHAVVRAIKAISLLAIPLLLSFFPLFSVLKGVKVYEEFVEGAKEGFNVAVRIIPFLLAILVAVGMFRGAGGIDMLTKALQPALDLVNFPAELVPMALMRPLSGGGSFGILGEMVQAHGPDHILSRIAATMYGSTETTFYVIAVYFGSVAIRRTRHAVPAGLMADITGIIMAVVVCRVVFG